jgi:RNA polymerase sigma-70 factor (ECF subfamily)
MLNTIREHALIRIGRPEETPTAEADLVAQAKEDRQAFGLLYDRYLDAVYRFCAARLGTREAAEDATSLVFMKALDALPACRNGSFRPWLFAIARNVVADHHRGAYGHRCAPLDAAGDVADPAPAPDELAAAAADRTVQALLAHLPPDQRDVVELRLAGLTGPEIARALGRSHGAIRIAQYRAYTHLRALLAMERAPTPGEP